MHQGRERSDVESCPDSLTAPLILVSTGLDSGRTHHVTSIPVGAWNWRVASFAARRGLTQRSADPAQALRGRALGPAYGHQVLEKRVLGNRSAASVIEAAAVWNPRR